MKEAANNPFPSTEAQLRARLDHLAAQLPIIFEKQTPGATAEQYMREIVEPVAAHLSLGDGTKLVLDKKLIYEAFEFERFALLLCCGFTVQALLALQHKDTDLAALLAIPAYYFLGILIVGKTTREIETDAIAQFCAVGPRSKNEKKYGKLKNLVESVALLQPEGPWESLAAAAKFITPLLEANQELLGQWISAEDPEGRVKIWLGKMKNKAQLFNIKPRKSKSEKKA